MVNSPNAVLTIGTQPAWATVGATVQLSSRAGGGTELGTIAAVGASSVTLSSPAGHLDYGTVSLWLSVRVSTDQGRYRPEGLPRDIQLPRWRVITPDGTTIKPGDVFSVTGKGTYNFPELADPATVTVSTTASTVQSRLADGTFNLSTNQTVNFERKTAPGQTNLVLANKAVYIWPPSPMDHVQMQGMGLTWEWAVAFDPLYRFDSTPTGTIRDGDAIRWIGPKATATEIGAGGRQYTLRNVDYHWNPYPVVTATFIST